MTAIDWLVCSTNPAVEECLCVEATRPLRIWFQRPATFLSAAERETLASLRFPKRRQEWLLGRWTAKQLLKRFCDEYATLPLDAISIGNDPDGAPYLSVAGQGRLDLSLSISHRNDRAFCALLAPPPKRGGPTQATVGADLEEVEPRDPAFVRDFFTAAEAERVWRCAPEIRDTLVTTLWSVKEAVLKALRLGLTVDTRRVEVWHVAGIESLGGSPSGPLGQWAKAAVHCSLPNASSLCAWWRLQTPYVFTLAASNDSNARPSPADGM